MRGERPYHPLTMAKNHDTWTVLPHGPIEKLTENLWRVEGDLGSPPIKRVMTIAKRDDGGLVVHGPMALEEAAMKEIEAFGPVATIVVPNGFHRMDAKVFRERYPQAKVVCPRGSRARVEQVVAVDGDFGSFAEDGSVSLEHARGVREIEGVMRVRSGDGVTLVLTDLVFNMPHKPGLRGFVLRHVLASSGGPRVSRIARLAIVKDKRAARAYLEELAATPHLKRVIVAHHETIAERPGEVLRQVAATL